MRKIWGIIALCLLWASTHTSAASLLRASISFYGNTLSLPYDNSINIPYSGYALQTSGYFAEAMEQRDYQPTLSALMDQQHRLQLNDWMYFQLIRQASAQLFPNRDQNYRTLFSWFMLTHSGYNALLLSSYTRPYIFVRSDDRIYGLPYVDNEQGRFVNISAFFEKDNIEDMQKLRPDMQHYNGQGKLFAFNMHSLPASMPAQPVDKWLSFSSKGHDYKVHVAGDKSVLSFMRNYPDLELEAYERIPLSDEAYQSLIPAFKTITQGMSEADAVRLLLSFTRTAFTYKTDEEAYHKENLMFSPEETLLEPYSDCEDRAILFSYMVHELLGLKTIYIEYPNHIMVGVNLPDAQGAVTEYQGEKYVICEPTGPQDVLEIGELPPHYRSMGFHINP